MRNLQPPCGSIRRRLTLVPLPLALLFALPCSAQSSSQSSSLRLDYELGIGAAHSDNIGLDNDNKRSETVLSPSISLQANKDSADMQVKARGTFQYATYLNNQFDDDFIGDFAGQMNWHVMPERLALVVADYLGRTPINLLNGLSAGNQQEINVFTVGPTLYLRPGASTQAQIDVRLTDTRSSDTKDFDSKRGMVGASVFHGLDQTQSVSFTVEAGKVEFDTSSDNDYNRYNAFVGYRRQAARGYLELAGGYTRLRYKEPGTISAPLPGFPDVTLGPRPRTQSGPLARLDANLQLTQQTRISAHARYELTDAANDMVVRNSRFDEPMLPDLTSPNLLVAPNVYMQRRFQLGYDFNNERLSAYVSPYIERVTYEDGTNFEWRSRGVYASAGYRLRPRLDLLASGSFERREIGRETGLVRNDRDTLLRLQLNYAFSRHVGGWAGVQRRQRNSAVASADYTENMVMAGFTYKR